MNDLHATTYTAVNGLIGMASSTFAVLTTFQDQLEWGVRLTGGILGILVALITIWNLVKKKK